LKFLVWSTAFVFVACRGKRIRLLTPLATLTTLAIDISCNTPQSWYATRGFMSRPVPVITPFIARLNNAQTVLFLTVAIRQYSK
jgi:hypothetical protein